MKSENGYKYIEEYGERRRVLVPCNLFSQGKGLVMILEIYHAVIKYLYSVASCSLLNHTSNKILLVAGDAYFDYPLTSKLNVSV